MKAQEEQRSTVEIAPKVKMLASHKPGPGALEQLQQITETRENTSQ